MNIDRHHYLTTSQLEVSACLKLIHWHGVPLRFKQQVIKEVGSCFQALSLSRKDWQKKYQSTLRQKGLPNDCNIDLDLRWLSKPYHHFLPISCLEYPSILRNIDDAPIGLFVKGDFTALNSPQIAVVGSRRYTPMGEKVTMQLTKDIVSAGLSVTSGMALGIDSSAHLACCEAGGKTIAIAGCGLDIVYPRQNINLVKSILQEGCIVSEFPIGTPPRKENFPARNRIISGLSLATIVIEAARRSGSLITARLAAEQGKEVFAVPGSILSVQSQGCNWLIQQGATLLSSIDDVLFELQLPLKNIINENRTLSKSEPCQVLRAIAYGETSIDELLNTLQIDFQEVSSRLIELELDGLIVRGHNGHYTRVS